MDQLSRLLHVDEQYRGAAPRLRFRHEVPEHRLAEVRQLIAGITSSFGSVTATSGATMAASCSESRYCCLAASPHRAGNARLRWPARLMLANAIIRPSSS